MTNIESYDVGHDKFCIKWSPHRAATSYRIKLNPADRKSPSLSPASVLNTFGAAPRCVISHLTATGSLLFLDVDVSKLMECKLMSNSLSVKSSENLHPKPGISYFDYSRQIVCEVLLCYTSRTPQVISRSLHSAHADVNQSSSCRF